MYSVNIMGLILTLGGLIFLIAGYIQHRYSAKKMMKMGNYIITLGLSSWIVDLQLPWSVVIAITIVTVGPIIMLFLS